MNSKSQFYHVSRFIINSVLPLCSISMALAAHAAQPIIQSGYFDDLHPAPRLSQLCGLPIVVRETGYFRDIVHSDNAGEFVLESLTFQHYTVTVTNFASGTSFTSPSAGLIQFMQDDAFSAGLVTHFVIPEGGSLTVDSGRIYFGPDGSIVLNGNFDVRSGDAQPLCNALAKP